MNQVDIQLAGGVNLSELLVRAGHDHELIRELLEIFRTESPELVEGLRRAVRSSDMKLVATTSHALKGMLVNLAVTRGSQIASQMETMARNGETAGLDDALVHLEKEIAAATSELDSFVTGSSL